MKAPGRNLLMVGNHFYSNKYNKNVWHFLAQKLKQSGWKVITTSNKIPKLQRLMDMLWTIWSKRHDYSVAQVDVFSRDAFFWAECSCLLLHQLNKPIVLTLHGGRLPEFGNDHQKRIRRLLNLGTIVVTPSPFIQNGMKKYGKDIRLIKNPIDLPAAIYRERTSPQPKLIWLRSFHRIYNPILIPQILNKLEENYPEISILMVGPDKGDGSLQDLESLAEHLGVRHRIEIIGSVDHQEICKYLDKGDIFVNTSNYDTAPRSLLEAMANGLCIVSTNVGGIPWLAKDGVEALLVPPDNPELMAKAIAKILSNAELASALSRNARNGVEQSDWSMILPQWESIFLEAQGTNDETAR